VVQEVLLVLRQQQPPMGRVVVVEVQMEPLRVKLGQMALVVIA
jgi:hypothetical protein